MPTEESLICAYVFDGEGGARQLDWDEVAAWSPEQGSLWVHLERTAPRSRDWLAQTSGLDALVVESLLAEETRPRSLAVGAGLLVILRGVNLNPGAEPEDMVSVRLWVEERRVVSTRARRLMAVQDIRDRIGAGAAPSGPADLMVQVIGRLIDRIGPVVDGLDDAVDDLEERLLQAESREIRRELGTTRRRAIALRRYVAPQRDALARLCQEDRPWLRPEHKARLRETTDRILRYVEDLDEVRERAAVVQDELMNRLSEQMNRTMYLLTIVAAIMLPLGFLTGLLGINVGGIPFAESRWGFAIVCAALALLVGAQVWLFRRLRWL